MSDNVEILRLSVEAFNAGDLDRYIADFVAPDVGWCTSAEDPDAGEHTGQEALRRYIEQWMDSFDGLRAEVEEWIDAGDDHVLAWARWTGRGRTSGVVPTGIWRSSTRCATDGSAGARSISIAPRPSKLPA